jgi:hypothetical protein
MAYVPEWERLSEALARVVVASGLSRREAKHDICRAVADQKIRVRPRVEFIKRTIVDHQFEHQFARAYHRYVRQLLDRSILLEMPSQLSPQELDWNESRLKSEWLFQPGMKGFPGPPRYAAVGIELRSADVTRVLCKEGPTVRATSSAGAKRRGIENAIDRLWPNGSPEGLSAKDRNRAILDQMGRDGSSKPANPERAVQRALRARRSQ